jgi:hypothetical protein
MADTEIEKVSETVEDRSTMRCLRCTGLNLVRSGKEVYRFECSDCGQHYFAVMQLIPVAPPTLSPILESTVAERRSGAR